eukprot:403366138
MSSKINMTIVNNKNNKLANSLNSHVIQANMGNFESALLNLMQHHNTNYLKITKINFIDDYDKEIQSFEQSNEGFSESLKGKYQIILKKDAKSKCSQIKISYQYLDHDYQEQLFNVNFYNSIALNPVNGDKCLRDYDKQDLRFQLYTSKNNKLDEVVEQTQALQKSSKKLKVRKAFPQNR